MKRLVFSVLSILLSVYVSTGAVWAQHKGSIELKAVAEQEKQVINDKGEKELTRVPVARVVPGDEVIYTISYSNVGQEPADNVFITNPVPEHMFYREESASGSDTIIAYSVDNGKTYDLPEKLTVVGVDGKKHPAKGSDYTHIRWTLKKSLAPGKKGHVSFRAQLE